MKSRVELRVTGDWRDVDDAVEVIYKAFQDVESQGCSYFKETGTCTEVMTVFQEDDP